MFLYTSAYYFIIIGVIDYESPKKNAAMTRKVTLALLLCVAWSVTALAQNSVESIRNKYKEVHEMIAHMMPNEDGYPGMPPEYYDINVVQNLPATGGHFEKIRMFYGELEPEEEGDPYPPHYLLFVTSKYNFAAREFYEEYLYDKDGRVMFIFAITTNVDDDMAPYELRLWFDGNKLLRFTAKRAENAESFELEHLKALTFKEVYSGNTIPEKYQYDTDRCLKQANSLLKMFKGVDENTYK